MKALLLALFTMMAVGVAQADSATCAFSTDVGLGDNTNQAASGTVSPTGTGKTSAK